MQGNKIITEKESHLYEGSIKAGVAGMQGKRNEMEDSHIIADMPSKKDHLFLAVFDGCASAHTLLINL